MSWLSSKAKRKLGVDMTPHSIKFVELYQHEHQYRIENYGIYRFAEPMMTGGLIRDQDALTDAIRQRFKLNRFSIKTAVLAVPDAFTLRKIISVSPHLSADDLEQLAGMEVGKLWPHATDPLNFDFQWCQPKHNDSSLRDLLIIASRSDYIQQRSQVARSMGLRVRAIDVESQALYRVYTQIFQANLKTIGWIHFEATSFDVYIFDQDLTIFTHREALKAYQNIDQALFVQQALNQVQSVLQVFQSSYPMYDVFEQMIVSAAASSAYPWASAISALMDINVVKINPFDVLTLAKHLDRESLLEQADELLIALGLALRP